MNPANRRIRAALLNRDLTHSTFRLYMALVELLEDQDPKYHTTLWVGALKAIIPGVKGKSFGEGPLREALGDLQDAGLIKLMGAKWSKVYIQVALVDPPVNRAADSAFAQIVATAHQFSD